jgi:hypothetical protein
VVDQVVRGVCNVAVERFVEFGSAAGVAGGIGDHTPHSVRCVKNPGDDRLVTKAEDESNGQDERDRRSAAGTVP